MAVLDGGVAVRCNPKPALAGLKSRSRSSVHRPTAGSAVLKAWSCAATTFEPCQVRKEAAVRSVRRVPQGCRARASGPVTEAARRSTTGARPHGLGGGNDTHARRLPPPRRACLTELRSEGALTRPRPSTYQAPFAVVPG